MFDKKEKKHNVLVNDQVVWSHNEPHTLEEWEEILKEEGVEVNKLSLMTE